MYPWTCTRAVRHWPTRSARITTNNPAATGKYSWHVGKYIGGTAIAGEGYLVVISSYTPEMKDSSNGPFTITKGTLQADQARATKGLSVPNLGPQAAMKKAPDKLTVGRPAANNSFYQGAIVRVHWTMATPLGGSVRITLLDPGEKFVQTITASAENKGAYDWVIPSDTPVGSYRVKVQVLNSDVSDTSDVFQIKKNIVIPDGVIKIFRVISPPLNQVIKPPNQPVHVIWETEYPGPFNLDMCQKNAIGHWEPKRSVFREQTFNPVSSSGGLSRYIADVLINSDDPSTPDGWYKVKVSVGEGGLGAFSEAFRIERGTVKKQVILEAAEIVDRYAETVIAQNPVKRPPGAWLASKPSLSRVGFVLDIDDTFNYHEENLYVFRSKVRFPLEPYKGKTIAKATLRLVSQASWIDPLRQNTSKACGGKLIFLTQPWNVNVGSALNASGVQLATIPNQLECTFDVTQPIKDTVRISGGFPNLGFLLTSVIEDFPNHDTHDGCMT